MAARLRELHNQLKSAAKHAKEGKQVSKRAAAQRDQLWANIARTAVETKPYEQWLHQDK